MSPGRSKRQKVYRSEEDRTEIGQVVTNIDDLGQCRGYYITATGTKLNLGVFSSPERAHDAIHRKDAGK